MKNQIEKLITFLGDKENIVEVNHCMTRLRIEIRNSEKVNKTKLEELPLVKGVVVTEKNVQIVIGVKVKEVFKELENSLKNSLNNLEKEESGKKEKRSQLSVITELFLPMIPWILLTGFILAFKSVLNIFPESIESFFKTYLDIIFESLIYYFPVGFSYSIAKRYKGSEIMGILLGLGICKLGYGENLIVVIVSALVLLKIKKILNNYVWDSIKVVTVPGASLLITLIITKVLIAPVGEFLTNGLIELLQGVFSLKIFPLLAMIFGGVYALSVKYGVQHILLFIDLQLILSGAGTYFWPIVAISNIAQGSASLGATLFFNGEKREELLGALLAYVGITEPAMYGVNIRLKYPMMCALIASGVGSFLVGMNRVTSFGIGAGGLPALLIVDFKNIKIYSYSILITMGTGFLLSLIVGKIKNIKKTNK